MAPHRCTNFYGPLFAHELGIMKRLFVLLLGTSVFVSCTSSGPSLFGKQSAHEEYGKKLSAAGLKETSLGVVWFSAAETALRSPIVVTLPFKQVGYFATDKPRAVGIKFSARRGEELIFQLKKKSSSSTMLFAELWSENKEGKQILVFSFDSTTNKYTYAVKQDQSFIFRLQPSLLESAEYHFSISVGPSLGFPVSGKAAKIGSVWGDSRDAGARSHEGIDIFAPKGTPVVASLDGTVTRVDETPIGGKVVWLRPDDWNISLYYAHLDEQLVQSGKRAKRGDTLGRVGNTGNAKTTPPHLHFGIYAVGGAVNPLTFVNPVFREAPNVNLKDVQFNEYYRLKTDVPENEALTKGAPVLVTDIASSMAIVNAPDGRRYDVAIKQLQPAGNQSIILSKLDAVSLLEKPNDASPKIASLPAQAEGKVLGVWNGYRLVETRAGVKGWIPATER